MGYFNRTAEEERLMRGPLSNTRPVLPWNQEANIIHNRRQEKEAEEVARLEANRMLQLRLQAEEAASYNPQPVGYTETQEGYAPTYSDQDYIEMNRRGDEMRAQQRYNDEMGASYSGGATQAGPLVAPMVTMEARPDTSGGYVQVGPLGSNEARPTTVNEYLDSQPGWYPDTQTLKGRF